LKNSFPSYTISHSEKFQAGQSAYTGKILRVDLTDGKIWHDEPDPGFYRKLIGGRGFILHYLLSEMAAGTDPLSPGNLLIFAAGLLTGTVLPGTGRHAVGAKSPLTGALASSEAGGWWGRELKRAGFDAVVISGQASRPVFLAIIDGKVSIREADHLWGKLTADVEGLIRQDLEDEMVRIAQIGPAGENQVLYAAIMHDVNRAAGRSGLGAVMGSKNLKAVAVRGSQRIGLADKGQLKDTLKWITSTYKDSLGWAISQGTSGSVEFNHDAGGLAIRNYQSSKLAGVENISGEKFHQEMVVDRDTCSGCPVRCKIVVEGKKLKIDKRYGGPEYESIGGLGALTEISDPEAVSKANELCAAYGLDTISTGGTIAFAMECSEKGLITDQSYRPQFGNAEDLIKCIHLIARQEGLGKLMAKGSAKMAEALGGDSVNFLAVSRKQEMPFHDPRLKNATGMGYALSPTGADHMHNLIDNFANFAGSDVCNRLEEMGLEVPIPLFGITPLKVKAYYYETAFKYVFDSAVICHFYPYEYSHMVEAFKAAGGWEDFSAEEINTIGNRIITMARLFILREGGSHDDDQVSAKVYQALPDGPIAGRVMPEEDLIQGIQNYFSLMGWNDVGEPQELILKDLDLDSYTQ
jgi:aldehyde:ferredoxin oxidoreductase